MIESPPSPAAGEAQDRPIPARSPRRLTLGTRLTLSVAVSVGLVIGLLTLGAMRIAGGALEADLRDTARLTALGVADDIELRPEPVTEASLRPVLEDFLNAAADLSSISVFTAAGGRAVPLISTSAFNAPPSTLVEQAMSERRSVWNTTIPHLAMVAVPVRRGEEVTGAVAVAVSLSGVERLRRTTGLIAAGGAALALGVITLLIRLLASRLVLEPLGGISRVMARARAGDLSARAQVPRDDEMRELADGLNAMLAELEGFQRLLTERVDLATGELRLRNEQLVRSYESVLRLREEAARAQQLATIGQTVANVAHQIGTPLNLVSGHVQLLRSEVSDPRIRRRLRIVEEQVERVAESVRTLLQRARPHADHRPVLIAEVLQRLAELMRARLLSGGVRLHVHAADDLPSIAADGTQIELALLNIISNAGDAMPAGGTLVITAQATTSGVRLEIRDTGTGIAPDILPRIFEPWVTTKPPGRGTGLGLSIARDVITGLGGTIAVDSLPGRGTTFTIDLPANTMVTS